MQSSLPAPTATGSFIKTPFPHLLVYALERRLTGTFELSRNAASMASITVVGGCPAKVRTSDPVHFLGNVMLELAMIAPAQLQASLARMQDPANRELQGQILLQMGVTDPARLDAGLRSQVERKIEHLFGLSTDTTFAYYDGVDLLQTWGGPPTPIDPFPVLWRGCREQPALEHVDATFRRVGSALLRASASSQLHRFAFTPIELQAIELVRQRPTRAADIAAIVGPKVGQVLVYFLMIMKQVDLLEAAAPAPAPPSAPLPPAPGNDRAIGPPTPVPLGQAFARVQLQRQASRAPFVVEEHVVASADDRAAPNSTSSAPIAPAAAGDIGSMINQSIQQCVVPPPMSAPSGPAGTPLPPPDAVPQIASEPPPVEANAITEEHAAMRQRILERSDTINTQDYFQMLGIPRDAQNDAIQKAFFGLAKVWHPDRLPASIADVKDQCSKVFTHFTEAHATLMDATRRAEYMTLLKDGGATPEDQQKIQAILEAAMEFQKAEHLLKRNPNDAQAYDMVRRCVGLDPGQSDYMATLAWLDAQKPEWLGREKTLEKTKILDRCILKNPNCERAFFYRGLLYKRAEEPTKALKDFKRAAELNPRNLDAMREVRLYNMRGGRPANAGTGGRPSVPPAPAKPAGLFGKLFKK